MRLEIRTVINHTLA